MNCGLFCIILFLSVCGPSASYGKPTIKSFKVYLDAIKGTIRGYKKRLETHKYYGDKTLKSEVKLDQVEAAFIASRISMDLDFFNKSLHFLVDLKRNVLPKHKDTEKQISKAITISKDIEEMSKIFKKMANTLPANAFETSVRNYKQKTSTSNQAVMKAEFKLLKTFEPFIKCLVKTMKSTEIDEESTEFGSQTLRLLEMCNCQIRPCLKETENTGKYNTEERKKNRNGKSKNRKKTNTKKRQRKNRKGKSKNKKKANEKKRQRKNKKKGRIANN